MTPAFIPSPSSNGFHLGPLFVHAYGLMYVLGVSAAITLTVRRWEKQGGRRELVYEIAMWGFPAGLAGGRLYNLATSWNTVPHHWWGPFAIWKGGLGIWGGIAAGTLVGLWRLRRANANIPAFMDAAAPGLLIAQAIGRIGNYFNQELFGGPTTLPWALKIDPAHRPSGFAQYATFHPTFLYELIFDLALAATLIALGRRQRIRAPGLFALYVAGYSGFRICEELLRVDPSHHILGLRFNFYVASILTLAGLAWFVRLQRRAAQPRGGSSIRPPGALLAVAGAIILAGCAHTTNASASERRHVPASDIPTSSRWQCHRGRSRVQARPTPNAAGDARVAREAVCAARPGAVGVKRSTRARVRARRAGVPHTRGSDHTRARSVLHHHAPAA
jgi:prolipoprotein diacylglyceryl transferase